MRDGLTGSEPVLALVEVGHTEKVILSSNASGRPRACPGRTGVNTVFDLVPLRMLTVIGVSPWP
jgi:hypothetical protein